jgi:hypothetical protein
MFQGAHHFILCASATWYDRCCARGYRGRSKSYRSCCTIIERVVRHAAAMCLPQQPATFSMHTCKWCRPGRSSTAHHLLSGRVPVSHATLPALPALRDVVTCVHPNLQLPAGVVTGVDAVTYFASGAGKASDLIYCNLASSCSCPSAQARANRFTATAGFADCTSESSDRQEQVADARNTAEACSCKGCAEYNPYQLVAVRQQEADKQQHFIVSYNGVIHMRCAGAHMLEYCMCLVLFAVAASAWQSNAWHGTAACRLV